MSDRLSIVQQNRLTALARDIRKLHDSTETLARAARDKCNEAVAEALLLGHALNEVKEIVGHGKWLKWLEENCPKVSRYTAWRTMKLANVARVQHLENSTSLKRAYVAAGIIHEPETSKSSPVSEPQSEPILNVSATVEPEESDPMDPFRDSVRFMLLRLDKLSLELKSNAADVLEPLGRFWLEHRNVGTKRAEEFRTDNIHLSS